MKGGIFLTRERKNSKYGHFIKLTFEDENEFDEYISTLENLKTALEIKQKESKKLEEKISQKRLKKESTIKDLHEQ